MLENLRAAVGRLARLGGTDLHPIDQALQPGNAWCGRGVRLLLANTKVFSGFGWAQATRTLHANRQLLVGLARDLDARGHAGDEGIRKAFRHLSERSATLPCQDFQAELQQVRARLFAPPPTPEAADALYRRLQRGASSDAVAAAARDISLEIARRLNIQPEQLSAEDLADALQLAEAQVQLAATASRRAAIAAA